MAAKEDGEGPSFDRESVMRDLKEKGYAVIPDVCSADECDEYISEYQSWLSQFEEDEWPFQSNSIIQCYSIGHFECTWKARLKAKPVFESVWETKKLLTSIDGVSISFPPETQKFGVYNTGHDWLHVSQSAQRSGLHCYQGALYLEETTDTDYCFRVLSGSHKYLDTFYEEHPYAAQKSYKDDFYKLQTDDKAWFTDKGCTLTKVPVPKGGMVLWDSRIVEDSCKPEKDRPNSDRWRYVVFVCMTPAIWAKPVDMTTKKKIFKRRQMTDHWPSQGINAFDDYTPLHMSNIKPPGGHKHSKTAQTDEVKRLAGFLQYDFNDGESNGSDWRPEWKDN